VELLGKVFDTTGTCKEIRREREGVRQRLEEEKLVSPYSSNSS